MASKFSNLVDQQEALKLLSDLHLITSKIDKNPQLAIEWLRQAYELNDNSFDLNDFMEELVDLSQTSSHPFSAILSFEYFEEVVILSILIDNEFIIENERSDYIETAWNYIKKDPVSRAMRLNSKYEKRLCDPAWMKNKFDIEFLTDLRQIYCGLCISGNLSSLTTKNSNIISLAIISNPGECIQDTATIARIARSGKVALDFDIPERLAYFVSSKDGLHILDDKSKSLFYAAFVDEEERCQAVLRTLTETIINISMANDYSAHYERDADLLIKALRRHTSITPEDVNQAIYLADDKICDAISEQCFNFTKITQILHRIMDALDEVVSGWDQLNKDLFHQGKGCGYLFEHEMDRLKKPVQSDKRRLFSVAILTRKRDLQEVVAALNNDQDALFWLYKGTRDNRIVPLLSPGNKHSILVDDFSL